MDEVANGHEPVAASGLGGADVTEPSYRHSHIYDSLVTHDDDLVGLIAYGLYQKKKRRWISAFTENHKADPTEDDVRTYCFTYQAQEIGEPRARAENLLYGVSEEILQERMPGVREAALNTRIVTELEQLKSRIHEISGYKHHVVGHVVGFFVLVLLASLVTFAVSHEPSIADYLLNKPVPPISSTSPPHDARAP